jgi:hypothetical protein
MALGRACHGELWPVAQSTWATITAATAENNVIAKAVRGFWPWATASWVVSSPRERGLGLGVTESHGALPRTLRT